MFGVLPWFVTPGVNPRFDAMRSFQMWYWAHSANMVAFLHGFEAMNSPTVYLSHFWSLAVEEHFYLVWPLLIWKISDRKLPYVAVGLIISAFLLRVLEQFFAHPMTGTRVLVPERMDSLAIGGLMAILFTHGASFRLRQFARVALPLCCTILGADFLLEKGLWTSSPFVKTIGLDVIAVACASLMILLLTNARRWIGNRLIDNPFLRCMGKYSYGMYVIHWILAQTLDGWFPPGSILIACGSAAIADCLRGSQKRGDFCRLPAVMAFDRGAVLAPEAAFLLKRRKREREWVGDCLSPPSSALTRSVRPQSLTPGPSPTAMKRSGARGDGKTKDEG